jgi:hypothetical protein
VLPSLPCPAHGILFSQSTPRELNHPLHQVLDHVEVQFSHLNFSSGHFLNLPYLGVQRLAMALNRVGNASVKCPAQPILDADAVNDYVQVLILWAGSLQQPAIERLVLVCSIRDSPHLCVLISRVSACHSHLDNCGDKGTSISAFKNLVEICGSMDYCYNPPSILLNSLCGFSNPPRG